MPSIRTAEQTIVACRAAAALAAADTQLPATARDAIALLMLVVSNQHLQIDWLRRDLATVATVAGDAAPANKPAQH